MDSLNGNMCKSDKSKSRRDGNGVYLHLFVESDLREVLLHLGIYLELLLSRCCVTAISFGVYASFYNPLLYYCSVVRLRFLNFLKNFSQIKIDYLITTCRHFNFFSEIRAQS